MSDIKGNSGTKSLGPHPDSVIAGLFRTIAIDEQDIERLRQELANVRDFDARNLYERINSNGDS